MALSNDLISQFVKITNDENKSKTEKTVYGTIVESDGTKYVKLDGSELLTPISSTTDAKPNERVTVLIKDHSAIVTGNMSSPSARTGDVQEIGNKITEAEILIADKVSTKQLDAQIGRIDTLVTDNVNIKERLTATEADIDTVQADNVTINETLTAHDANIETLEAFRVQATDATLGYAKIADLNATNANVHNLEADYGDFKVLTSEKLEANDASIENLQTNKLSVIDADLKYATINNLAATDAKFDTLDSKYAGIDILNAATADIESLKANKLSVADADLKYANIDFSNIGSAAIEEFFSKSGMISDLVVGEGTITGKLVGVTIVGDLIEGGTVKADKLVILGEDGLYYKLNTNGETVEAQQTDYNSINGSNIQAQSITATKISVDDLVAFDATIGGFNITENSLYSGVKASVGNTTRGIYLDNDGQIAFGDANKFVKFYKDSDNTYKLAISADSILFGSNKKNIETAFEDVQAESDAAKANAEAAQTIANKAATDAKNAQTTADQAIADATNAQTKAEEAATNASSAQTKADEAKQTAINAQSIADTAKADAEAAQTDLETAKANLANVTSRVDATEEDIAAAQTAVATAQESADLAKTNAAKAQSTADTAKTNAATAQAAADEAANVAEAAQSTADIAKANAATAQTAANNAQSKADEAKKAADDAQADLDLLAVRVTTAETNISQNSEQIALRATKTEVTQTLSGYYTKAETDSALTVKANEISSTVDSKINGIQIGGRNLLRWTQNPTITDINDGTDGISLYKDGVGTLTYTNDGIKLTFDSSTNAALSIPLAFDGCIENGEIITLSFEYRGNISQPGSWYFMQRTTPSVSTNLNLYTTLTANETEWQRCNVTFSSNNANIRTNYRVLLFYNLPDYTPDNWIEIRSKTLKLEKGNKATDWTPAPEDMATQDDFEALGGLIDEASTQITQNAENIMASATKTELSESLGELYTKEEVDAQLALQAEQFQIKFTQATEEIQSVNDDLQEKFNTITKYFTFDINGLTIGAVDNPNKVVIDNDEIVIQVNGNAVQRFDSSGKGIIPELKVTRGFDLFGYLIDQDSNGNVNCEYVGGE